MDLSLEGIAMNPSTAMLPPHVIDFPGVPEDLLCCLETIQ